MKTKIFVTCLALFIGMEIIYASDTSVNGIWYDFDDANHTATVTYRGNRYGAYDEYIGEYIIPDTVTYNGKKYLVTSIGDNAFRSCTSLTNITIPNSVTSIGNSAFRGCTSLPIENNIRYADTYLVEAVNKSITACTIKEGTIWIGTEAFNGCSSLTSIEIPNSVTSIDNRAFSGYTSLPIENNIRYADTYLVVAVDNTLLDYTIKTGTRFIGADAFYHCENFTSIEIPNSVTSIGENAFRYCTSLETVTIGENITSLGNSVFNKCENIKTVHWNAKNYRQTKPNSDENCFPFYSARDSITSFIFGDSVMYVPAYLIKEMSAITEITLPNSVTEIGANNFYLCPNLVSVSIGENMMTIGENVFSSNTNLSALYVPCSKLESYLTAFPQYASLMMLGETSHLPYSISFTPSEEGRYTYPTTICDEMIITAIPNYGYHFVQWSDGNTENPREITLTQDTVFSADFTPDKNGNCGDNFALTWIYDDGNKVLTISGDGPLTSNYYFGAEAPDSVEKLIISEGVTAIGSSAFANYSTLKHISIAASVKTIYEQAFYNCTGLEEIFSYRNTPATAYSNSFDGIDKFNCTLHVLSASVDMYRAATGWRDFYYVQTIDAAEITESIVNVTIIPTESTAEITWPVVAGSLSYEIVITKNNEVVCTEVNPKS